MNVQINLEDMLSKVNFDSIKVLAQQDKLPLEVAALRHLEFLMSKRPAVAVAPGVPAPQAVVVPKPAPAPAPPPPPKASSKRAAESASEDQIATLNLGTRAYNVVTRADKLNVSTLEGFMALTEDAVSSCPGAGKAVIDEILEAQKRIRGTSGAPPAAAVVEAIKDYVPVFKKLPKDPNGVREAIKMFSAVNGADEAKEILGSSGLAKNDFESMINLLLDNMPIQPSQVMTVKDLGKELGEKLLVVEEDRPMAAFGKSLSKLTVGEAQSLINEMINDIKNKPEEEVESDDSLLDDFFT